MNNPREPDTGKPSGAIKRRTVLKSLGAAGMAATVAPLLPSGSATAETSSAAPLAFDWRNVAGVSKTSATLQLVVNPLIRRESPIHDNVFRELRELHAEYVRFVPWKPYPLLGVAELYPPADGKTSWDFSLIDPMVADFEQATRGHLPIMNFSTIPEWMWKTPWGIQDGELVVVGGGNGIAREGTQWTDYTFSVDVTPLATGTHSGHADYAQSGCLFRMQSEGDGYGFLLSNYPYSSPAEPGYIAFFIDTGNHAHSTQHKALPFPVVSGQTYHVSITVSGGTFTAAVNGTTVFSVSDPTYATGTVGFREYGTESGRFDNVRVTAPDGTVLLTDDFSDTLSQWDGPAGVPDDPDAVDFGYSQGTELAVPLETVGDYYGRLVSWYTAGGFTDEYGRYHRSHHHYQFPYWEVLNELEHSLSPELYTQLYDAIAGAIHRVSPRTKFVGLALATPSSAKVEYVRYFLDPANHEPGTPIDMISYHFYAHVTASETPDTYGGAGFAKADSFLAVVDQIEAVRKSLAPQVRTTVDETGTIMDAAATQPDPAPIPDAYWNFSAALYAYVFANLALRGIDIVGESQLVGYPSQYPSVSMVDWTTGLPNARYRVLQLLLEQMRPGCALVSPAPGTVPDSCYALGLSGQGGRRVLLVNKTNDEVVVSLRGVIARVVDQRSAGGPIRTEQIRSDEFTLGGYGVAILELGS